MSRPRAPWGLLIPVLLLLLALGLRAARLTFQPLWWDEGYSVWFATHPLGQMAALTAADIHPPLYYALLRGWLLVFGTGPVALRLFSVTVGLLAIPAVYVAGRRLWGSRAGWLAAGLLVINPLHIYYSQEIRMYGLVALLSALILAVAWPALRSERPGWRNLVPYVALVTAALYTQYYAVFLPIGLTVYALWRWRRNLGSLAVWLAAQLVAAALYLPWLLYATPKLIPYVSQKVVSDADRPLGALAYLGRHLSAFLAGHLEGPFAAWWPLALVLLLPWVAWAILALRGRQTEGARAATANGNGQRAPQEEAARAAGRAAAQPAAMLAVVVITALVLGFAINLRAPFFPDRGERLLLLALPPFVLLNADVLGSLWRRLPAAALAGLGLTVAVAAASLAAFYTVPRYPDDDYRPLIAAVVEQGRPQDTIFCVYPWQVGYWRAYGDPAGPQAVLTPAPAWGSDVAAALDAALQRGHLWFPAHLSAGALLESRAERYLGEHSRPFVNTWYGPGTRLSGWAATGATADDNGLPVAAAGTPISFSLPSGDKVQLVEAVSPVQPLPAANVALPITLTWQAPGEGPGKAPGDLAVSLRLVDGLGQIWAQHDYEPLGGLAGTPVAAGGSGNGWQAQDRVALLIPAGTPPGEYHIAVTVRPAAGTQALDAFGPDGVMLPHGEARLAGVTVTPAAQPPDAGNPLGADRPLGAERLPIAQPRTVDMQDGLRFLGFSTDPAPLAPGSVRKFSLFWQATARPANDYIAFLQLLDGQGKVVAGWPEAAPGAGYGTSQWTPGTLIRSQGGLLPPATLADGRYRLIAGLYRQSDGQRLLTAGGQDHVDLGQIVVQGRSHSMVAPQPAAGADVRFPAAGQLVGYDVSAASHPGATLPITLYWRGLAATDRPYTVFVHLVPATGQGEIQGYGDGEPGKGTLPTTSWVAGEYLTDVHQVIIATTAQPGVYRLAIGLYDPATGQRLPTADGHDQALLPTEVTVAP